jgi:hypothetical protein
MLFERFHHVRFNGGMIMKKCFILFLLLAPVLYAQTDVPEEYGPTLNVGKTATLGVEASTGFAWDVEDNSTGLETKAGFELIFDLFPKADRGIKPEDTDSPTVRLALKNAAFTWWNSFSTEGGNYEQDNFNHWNARPLILTFDTFLADLLWKSYFFRIASSTTVMQTDMITLRSIFDEVMDVTDRFYYQQNQALWRTDRYNIEKFPLLRGRLNRDIVDVDFRENISGILAAGAEFEKFGFTVKAASYLNGRDNNDNAWLFGADLEVAPIEQLKIDLSGFAAMNYDKTDVGENPISAGTMMEYQLPLSDEIIFTPFVGFDFAYDTASEEKFWEFGAGLMLYTRGYDTRTSSRVLDYDDVIPIGVSLAMNINKTSRLNMILSWFDPPGRDSLIPNFGGFLQFELANLLEVGNDTMDIAVLAQLEYSINGKITPYIRGGYKPEITGSGSNAVKTDDVFIHMALGLFLTPINFFSVDIRYGMDHRKTPSELIVDKGIFSAVFTIRM